jgi:hypothetical protein
MGKKKSPKASQASRYKPILKVVPAQNLASMVGMGLDGARYHFGKIQEILRAPGLAACWTQNSVTDVERVQLQHDINRFHWHLRAFFWELVAEMDLLRALIRQHPKRVTAQLTNDWQRAYDAQWFREIRTYRNFAHQSALFVQGLYGGPSNELQAASLLPAVKGQDPCYDLVTQLSDYLGKMEKLLKTRSA